MLCCVIGGFVVAALLARLRRLPWIGPLLEARRRRTPDPSNWRLRALDGSTSS